jgi:hypothetical protein
VVLFFLSAPLFPQFLCPRTYFALSKAFLFPDHIVAHRLSRRPHDGASASPTFTLGGRCGYFPWCDKGRVFDDDESILFVPLPAPALADAHPSIPFLHPFASSFATTVHLTDARRLYLDGPSLSPYSHLGVASLYPMQLSR